MKLIPADYFFEQWRVYTDRVLPSDIALETSPVYMKFHDRMQGFEREFGDRFQEFLLKLIDSNVEQNRKLVSEAPLELKLLLMRRIQRVDRIFLDFVHILDGIPAPAGTADGEVCQVLFHAALLRC